jgi:hypothetical protein
MPLSRFLPLLFGSSNKDQSYELSDGVHHGMGPRSGNWNSQSGRSRRRDEFEAGIDDLENYKSEGSEERIIGIKKTVSIDMTFHEGASGSNTDASKMYPVV